jgi:TonB family protein
VGCHIVPVVVQRSAPTLDRVARPYPTGTAILEVGVAENGHVVSVCVLRSVRPDFDHAAQAAVSRWLFKPPFLDGKPVGIVTTVTMDVPGTAR